MRFGQLLLKIFVGWTCVLGMAYAGTLPVDYLCEPAASAPVPLEKIRQLPSTDWHPATDGLVPVPGGGEACWVRIASLPGGAAMEAAPWLSFADLNVQRVNIALWDADGKSLGQAQRLGPSQGAFVTGLRAVFTPSPDAAFPLYARFAVPQGVLPFPGLAHQLVVEAVQAESSLRDEQGVDLLNHSGAVFLFTTALVALFFGVALREWNYGIYAIYALLQSVTIFTKSGLPFVLDASSSIWLNAWIFNYLVGVLSVLLNVRFGRFRKHSPLAAKAAYFVAVLFVVLIPLHFLLPAVANVLIYAVVPLHFLVLLGGNWRGWRSGERGCGILLLGLIPIAVYWLSFLLYSVVLRQPMPSEMALGSGFDFVRTLLLPIAFCYGIADRTLRLQRETARLARFDALTGLLNREGARQYGQQCIDDGAVPTALMLNVERFHAINETLGPVLGDQILKETGQRLRAASQDLAKARVGRMHADQFCMVVPAHANMAALRETLERLFNHPAEVDGQAVDIALSVGVAVSLEKQPSMAQLLRNAEIALDVGRTQHRNWLHYQAEMESSQRADLDLLSELKRAVEQGQLRMYLQPKVRLSDGSVSSAEALVRWEHPERGMIPPGDFVPFAEKTGRITLITRWMLRQAMELAARYRAEGRPLQISVNLSTFDLGEAGFAARTAALAAEVGVDPGDIRLEITESGAMQDANAALVVMNGLRNAGFSLSIDDFGTGYSSLAYLQKMPVAELKIDRAFVRHVRAHTDEAALLESAIDIGHRLGLSVVAEGPEDAQEWALLQSMGCDYAQGWYAAAPMPVAKFEAWCAQNLPFKP
ncbi:MAG: EAL domain-containing protein [Rhodoferax sp.]|nr:EAL domain-containing protein [Rhodoferax sp.]